MIGLFLVIASNAVIATPKALNAVITSVINITTFNAIKAIKKFKSISKLFLTKTIASLNFKIPTANTSPISLPNLLIASLLFRKNNSNCPSSLVKVSKKPCAIVICNSLNILSKDIKVPFNPFFKFSFALPNVPEAPNTFSNNDGKFPIDVSANFPKPSILLIPLSLNSLAESMPLRNAFAN